MNADEKPAHVTVMVHHVLSGYNSRLYPSRVQLIFFTLGVVDVLMPPPISDPHSFNTLYREWSFRNPTEQGSTVPILDELVAPHIESFNALFDDGAGDGSGLLSLAIKGIGEKVVFDGKDLDENGLPTGNRLSGE